MNVLVVGLILALTPEARTTVQLLKINQQNRVRERKILIFAGIM